MLLFHGSRAERLRTVGIPLVVVTLALAIQYRGVVCGRVFFFEDVAAYFEPLWTAAARAMRQGRLPTWAPEAWSGQPLLGDPQIGILYPLHWLWLWLHPLHTYALSVLLHSLIAAGGAYALARDAGRSPAAATASALSLSLSAYFVLEARHVMFLASAAWVPWLLLGIAVHARGGSRRSLVGIAVSLALALLAGGWSMLVFAVPVVGAYGWFAVRGDLRRLLSIGLGLGLGLGLAAIGLLPALAHAPLSPRALPLADGFAGSYAWPSLRYAVTLVAPLWYGDDARGTYVGAPDQWELCGYGVGGVAALLALAAFLDRGARRERLVYLGLVAAAMLVALGPHGPLWPLARALPLVGRTRCPARALYIYTLVAPLLVGAGVDAIAARMPRWRGLLWLAPILVAVELLVTFRAENPTMPLAQARLAPAVLASVPRDERTLIDVHLGQAFHNGGLRWGIESPGGYSSLPLWRYLHFLWIANHRAVYPGPALAHDLSAQGLWTLDSPLVDLLSVRWLLAPHVRPPTGSGWKMHAAGADAIDLWRNDEALPRAFFVHELVAVADEAAAAQALADVRFDPRATAIVEERLALDEGGNSVRELARLPGEAHFAVEGGGLLVYTEPYEPSWRVSIDGAPAPLLRVDYALQGVRVPRGAHEVRFVRVDGALRVGALCSLLALILSFVLVAMPYRLGWTVRRRR